MAPAVLAVVLVAGCGTETPGSGTDVGSTGPAATDPVPPEQTTTSPTTDSDAGGGPIGTVLVNATLGVNALEYPGPPLPFAVEVTSAEELAASFPDVAGIDEIAASVAASPPTADERLFAYVVAACVVDDLSLKLTGSELTMVVHGNSTIKCEPPAMQMVVWTVDADDVPADVVPAQAILK